MVYIQEVEIMKKGLQNYLDKIISGDCLEVLKDIPDGSIDLVLTDPPYNASNSNVACANKHYKAINEDWDKGFQAQEFLDLCYDKLKKNGSMIVFCSYHTLSQYLTYDKLKIQQIIHWIKTNPFPAIEKVYTPSVEYAVWFVKGSPYTFNKKFAGQNILTTSICAGEERTEHPTQKPLDLWAKLLQVHSNEGDVVLDCFSGSGTTAIACHRMNRHFICIEKDEKYIKISKQRLLDEKQQTLF